MSLFYIFKWVYLIKYFKNKLILQSKLNTEGFKQIREEQKNVFLTANETYMTHVFNTFSFGYITKLTYVKLFLIYCLKIYTFNNIYILKASQVAS